MILGAFAKLRKLTVSFVMSVRPSAWDNSAPTRRILFKFRIQVFAENVEKIQVSLKSDTTITGTLYKDQYTFFDHISLSSS